MKSMTETLITTENSIAPFAVRPRIGRIRYLAYTMSYLPIVQVLGLLPGSILLTYPAALVSYFCVSIQRTRDIGVSPWIGAVLAFPPLNLLLYAAPGDTSDNRYGAAPIRATAKEKGIALGLTVATVLVCFLSYTLVIAPALSKYHIRYAIGPYAWEASNEADPVSSLRCKLPRNCNVTVRGYAPTDATYEIDGEDILFSLKLDGQVYVLTFRLAADKQELQYLKDGKVVGRLHKR